MRRARPSRSSRRSPTLGCVFTRYGKKAAKPVRLVAPDGVDAAEIAAIAEAVATGRDLVNMPANDLGPDGLEAAARRLADRHGAAVEVIVGDDLLPQFPDDPRGRASLGDAARLIDIRRGSRSARHPRRRDLRYRRAQHQAGRGHAADEKGHGRCAAALALAEMIMAADPRLRVLVPAVENMISGASFRPGDVQESRG